MNKIGIFAGQFGYDSFDDLCSWGRGEFFRELKGLCESSNIGVYFGNEAESEILDFEIHVNYQFRRSNVPKILLLWESVSLVPKNLLGFSLFSKKYHQIYTWKMIKGKIYDKRFYYTPIPYSELQVKKSIRSIEDRKYKFSLIATNRNFNIPVKDKNNGYKLRQKFIDYFDNNSNCGELDLFGRGWNQNFRKFFLHKFSFFDSPRTFKKVNNHGKVTDKEDVLHQSIFNICLENQLDQPNYYTEKILDCLICGAIPIYSGDKSIYKFIPRGCVIEYRDFSDASKVIEYCNSLTNEELITIQKNIIKFVSNFNWYEISEKKFAKEIFYKIQKAIKK